MGKELQSADDEQCLKKKADRGRRVGKLCGRRAQSARSQLIAPGYITTVSPSDGEHAPQEKSGPSSTHRVLLRERTFSERKITIFYKNLQIF